MGLIRITDEEAYKRLDEAYNPPAFNDSYTAMDFTAEWHEVRDQLDHALKQFGTNDPYGDGDYNLGDTLAFSRGIGVELNSDVMIHRALLDVTQQTLLNLRENYEVDFALITQDGIFHVFVDRNDVRAWVPNWIYRKLSKMGK